VWAALNNHQGAFNVTNGDQFRWKHVWPKLAYWFGVDVGEPQPISLQQRLNEASADLWQDIATKYELEIDDISTLAQGAFGDFIFNVETDAVFDVTKARQHGFTKMQKRSDDDLIAHLEAMVEQKLIPAPHSVG